MGKKGTSISTSVDPSVGEAQKKMAEIAEREQDWYENKMYPWMEEQTAVANKNAEADRAMYQQDYKFWQDYATQNTDKWNQRADDYYNRWQQFVPTENSLIQDAERYNTNAEAERQAALAYGDAATAFAAQRQANNMQMQAYGINPTAGAYQAQQNAMGLQQAAIQAQASNAARQAADELGWNKRHQVAALGQNYINASLGAGSQTNAVASTGGGLMSNALAGGSQASQTALGNVSNFANVGLKSYQSLGGAWGNYGNLGLNASKVQQQAQIANAEQKSAQAQGAGSMVGTGITAAATVAAAYI
jgi:hypothetical protein